MKYSKILLATLSLSLLASCANSNTTELKENTEGSKQAAQVTEKEVDESKNQKEEKDKNTPKEVTKVDEDNKEEDEEKDKKEKDKKNEDGKKSDLVFESDFDILKGDLMDISDEDPSSLGLEKSDKDPKELVDAFFDEKIESLFFDNNLVVGNDSEQSAQKFYGGVEYKDEELFSGHFASMEYDNSGVKSTDELLVTNNPDSEYQFYNFDQDGSPKGSDTDEDYAAIRLNPEIYSLMGHVKEIANKLEAYEDKDGQTHLYYKSDKLGELLELFRDDYSLKVDNANRDDFEDEFEEKLVLSYLDDDNLPDRFMLTIGHDEIKIIVNTVFTEYNEVDKSVFEPISIIDDSDRVKLPEVAENGPMDIEALKNIAGKISSKSLKASTNTAGKKAVDDFIKLVEDAKFQNFFIEVPEADDQKEVEKYLDGFYEKEETIVQDDDTVLVYRYNQFEDKDVGETNDLDITVNFLHDKLSLVSITPGFYDIKANEVIKEEDIDELKTITDVDRSPVKPLSIAYMPLNEKQGIQIMVPSKSKDGSDKATYLFFIENDLLYKTDIPFEQASQDFSTASHKMFRTFVGDMIEKYNN